MPADAVREEVEVRFRKKPRVRGVGYHTAGLGKDESLVFPIEEVLPTLAAFLAAVISARECSRLAEGDRKADPKSLNRPGLHGPETARSSSVSITALVSMMKGAVGSPSSTGGEAEEPWWEGSSGLPFPCACVEQGSAYELVGSFTEMPASKMALGTEPSTL